MSRKCEDKPVLGRPKSEEKRRAILAAAGRVFLEHGYASASVDSIAREAEVSKATIYSHFENKDELFQNCIRNKVESYDFSEQVVPPEALVDALEFYARRYLALLSDPAVIAMHRVVIGEAARHSDMAKLFYQTGPQQTINTLAAYLDTCQAKGVLTIPDSKLAAAKFFNMIAGERVMRAMLGLPCSMGDKAFDAHVGTTVKEFIKLYAGAAG